MEKQDDRDRRIARLEAQAFKVKVEDYQVRLTDEERTYLKNEIAELSVEIAEHKKEYDIAKHAFKVLTKKPKSDLSDCIRQLSHGRKDLNGTIYYIYEEDTKMVVGLDSDGLEVVRRHPYPEEVGKLKTLFS